MAKNIKGITIELDGDTKGLDKAISGISKQSIDVAKELKEVEKLLKFDPGNSELLAQKQQLLAKQIENTSDKLAILKEAQSQVNDQFAKGEINDEQYRAFQREVQATEGILKGYQNQLSSMQTEQSRLETNTKRLETLFQATGTSADDFADVLGNRLVSAIKNGSATSDQLNQAINKIGGSALGADADLDKMKASLDAVRNGSSMDELKNELSQVSDEAGQSQQSLDDMGRAVTSGTVIQATEVIGDLGDKVIELGNAAKDAALESESAFSTLNATTNLSGQELENLKSVATDVFKSGVTDSIDEAVNATSLMKSAFSELNDQQLGNLTAQVITLSTRTGTDVQENVKGASQLMNAFGLDAESAFDLVASGYQNNLNYSGDFMDTLNEYAPLFSQAGYSADEMLSILQNGMENGAMNTDKTADAIKEMQIRLGDGSMDKVIENFSSGTKTAFENWKNGKGTVKDVANSVQEDLKKMSPTEQQQALSLLSTQFEDLGIGAATSLFGVQKGFDDVSGAMDKATEKDPSQEWQASLNDFSTVLQEIGTKILEALQPVMEFIADVANKFNELSAPVQNFILIFGGITAVIAIIAPIIAAITAIGATALGIAGIIGVAIAAIIAVFMNWGTIVDWLSNLWNSFTAWLSDTWNNIASSASSIWGSITSSISSLVSSGISTVQNLWNSAMSFISGIWSSIQSSASSIWNGITSAISNAINTASSTVSSVVNGISSTVSGVWNGIKSTTSAVWNGIKSAMTSPIETAKGIIAGIVDRIKGLFNFTLKFPEISIPHIPLPHFKISGSFNPLKGQIPSLGIDWFANGGILTKPTVFGANGGNLMAGGEAGNEAVLPLNDRTLGAIGEGIVNAMSKRTGNSDDNKEVIRLLNVIADKSTVIEMDGRKVAEATHKEISRLISNSVEMVARGALR